MQGEKMAFTDNLKRLPSVEDLEKLDLIDEAGKVVAIIENKPRQSSSLEVYHQLLQEYGAINASAAIEGLTLFAEHTNGAEQNPGYHPNIDRLFRVIEENWSLSAKITRK